jgi:hypothetical protein
MAREDKLVERITYLTKIALGEEPNKDFSEAILQAAIKAAKVGYSFAVDEAAEWLDENMNDVGIRFMRGDEIKDIVDLFRKAMKGGENENN